MRETPVPTAMSKFYSSEQLKRESRLMELDPKYCDVIVRRFIELVGNDDGVFLLRNGEKIHYADM